MNLEDGDVMSFMSSERTQVDFLEPKTKVFKRIE